MASAVPSLASVTCKGTTIKAALAFLEERARESRRQQVLARLPADTRQQITGLILPSGRYQVRTLVELCEAIDAELGRGDLALCQEIGRHAAEYEVTLLHKVFLAVANIEYWFKAASATWLFYYSAGTLSAEWKGKTGGTVRLAGFNPHGRAFCLRFTGWLQRVCELSRLRDIRIAHTCCVLDGGAECVWEGTWKS